MKDEITKIAKDAIKNKVFPGCVVGIVKKNGEREILPFGNFTYDNDSTPVEEDSVYDVASLTKSIVTGSLALQLIDRGDLNLHDKLIDYVPEFNNSDRENVTIKHLLTYTLDGYGLASLDSKNHQDLLKYIMNRDFDKPLGKIFKYTNIPAFLLGMVIENIHGKTINILSKELFFTPLDMRRTTMNPGIFPISEIVPTEIDFRGLVQGEVHDESAWIFKTQSNKAVGHAGLFSTAPDILTFLEMLLNEGFLKNQNFFSSEIIKEMYTNQIPGLDLYTGLGWELYQPRYMGEKSTPNTFGKTGFTGCLCICNTEKEVAYVILSNRIYPKRPKDSISINKFRSAIGDIVWQNNS